MVRLNSSKTEYQRELRRLQQIRYRKKHDDRRLDLESKAKQLREDIAILEARRCAINLAIPGKETAWTVLCEGPSCRQATGPTDCNARIDSIRVGQRVRASNESVEPVRLAESDARTAGGAKGAGKARKADRVSLRSERLASAHSEIATKH
ncbi:hypothetical protein ON010_g4751 [Phytophthora cinnamomi]|nr:hypothetical protein ON010_g4751 [Phytophthora cinnamomi]